MNRYRVFLLAALVVVIAFGVMNLYSDQQRKSIEAATAQAIAVQSSEAASIQQTETQVIVDASATATLWTVTPTHTLTPTFTVTPTIIPYLTAVVEGNQLIVDEETYAFLDPSDKFNFTQIQAGTYPLLGTTKTSFSDADGNVVYVYVILYDGEVLYPAFFDTVVHPSIVFTPMPPTQTFTPTITLTPTITPTATPALPWGVFVELTPLTRLDDWRDAIPTHWLNPVSENARYVVTIGSVPLVDEDSIVETCEYTNSNNVVVFRVYRKQVRVYVSIYDRRSDNILEQNTFLGSMPEGCPEQVTFSSGQSSRDIFGERPPTSEFVEWLFQQFEENDLITPIPDPSQDSSPISTAPSTTLIIPTSTNIPTRTPTLSPTRASTRSSDNPLSFLIGTPVQLETGTVVDGNSFMIGSAILTVENGNSVDAVATLTTLNGEVVQAVYIQAGDTHSVRGITDGSYYLYFTLGTSWNETINSFLEDNQIFRFEDTLSFTGSSIARVTLHPVADGNADTIPVDSIPKSGN